MNNSIAFSLDQSLGNRFVPLTEFYFWPQKDAWELIKLYLESLNWISQEDAVLLLNRLTEIINFWQSRSESSSLSVNDLKAMFPDVAFIAFE